jgi:sarcosine oxidase subunit beta
VTIRSNYLRDQSIPFYVKSVSLFEGLTRELNINLMYSKRTMIDVVQTSPKLREIRRRMLNGALHGSTYEPISVEELRRRIPPLTGGGPDSRLPIMAGMVHTDAATCRHDAVAWGFARSADAMGVEIHQNTPVQALLRGADGRIQGVRTSRGDVRAAKVAVVVSGHTTTLTETVGLRLPLKTINLSAYVSEPVKPLVDVIVNCPDIGVYLSQSDRGELIIGGATDPGQSFRRDIKQSVFEDSVGAMLELFPSFRRLKMMRQWGGALDIAHDATPIVSATPIGGLYVSAGWWGGFKAVPAGGYTLAHLIARDEPHPLIEPFSLERFRHLDYVMESGTTTAR